MKRLAWLLVLVPFLFGCAKPPVEVNHFIPAPNQLHVKKAVKHNSETYSVYDNDRFKIETAIYEYKGIIVVPLEITNKEKKDIEPQEYKIALSDGRDYKEIKMLSRQDIILTRGRYQGNPPSLGLSNQLIETTFQTVSSIVSPPTKDRLIQALDYAINNYFSFRPIYAGETRTGILCFLVDFKLEYPLTLTLAAKEEKVHIYFWPDSNLGHVPKF